MRARVGQETREKKFFLERKREKGSGEKIARKSGWPVQTDAEQFIVQGIPLSRKNAGRQCAAGFYCSLWCKIY